MYESLPRSFENYFQPWFSFSRQYKEGGVGSVAMFKEKRIIGVLAGRMETSNTTNKKEMDTELHLRKFEKWFDQANFGAAPSCSPFQASEFHSRDAPAESNGLDTYSPGTGTSTTTAAMPHRARQVAKFPVRRATQVQFRPRLRW